MFSSKDFEKCWFLYQTEGLPHDLSIEQFCEKQGVPVNEFNKWYRDTHKQIVKQMTHHDSYNGDHCRA